jgi:hypothetical protein
MHTLRAFNASGVFWIEIPALNPGKQIRISGSLSLSAWLAFQNLPDPPNDGEYTASVCFGSSNLNLSASISARGSHYGWDPLWGFYWLFNEDAATNFEFIVPYSPRRVEYSIAASANIVGSIDKAQGSQISIEAFIDNVSVEVITP